VSEREAHCLIDRYDKSKDGKISYSEFIDEIKPKAAP
jgi:Ca2+-binding EF-hand superfamily protein